MADDSPSRPHTSSPKENESVSHAPAPAHLIDSRVLSSVFVCKEVREIFTDRAMVQSWLDAEVALAQAQAELDMIPADAPLTIQQAARSDDWDLDAIATEIERTAHPLVPVVRVLAERSGAAGAYVHLGATTQDITDTGLVLQCKQALDVTEELVRQMTEVLAGLAERYRDLPMVGRTHAQHALPITLGFKFAVLLAEMERHLARIADVRPRVLVGQLGGAVGSMASFGGRGPELLRLMTERLGLRAADITWHTSRDGFAELTCVLAMISATCGKVANEIRVLQRTEVAELEEPFLLGKVGSSTMPHKRNPMYAEFILSNAIVTRQAPASMLAAMLQEHERDMSMWGVEWLVLPETFVLTAGLVERTTILLQGLIVHPEAIHRNLHMLGDLMLSEAAMMQLAETLGKSEAHEVVYRAAMKAWDTGGTLKDMLLEDESVSSRTNAEELAALLVPESYLGSCQALVDQVLASNKARRAEERS
jgi:3-carboxy-cis,cis-muconate cycloisomerase